MADKTLTFKYAGDPSGVKRALGEIDKAHASIGQKLDRLGKGMTRAGSALTLGLTLPMIAFGKIAVDEATEAAAAQKQTEAAIKSTGGAANVTLVHVANLSDKLGTLAAIDDDVVQAGENVLLTFTKVRNEAGKGNDVFDQASRAALDLSARMGTDLNSAMVLVGKAVNDPIKGLSALTRVGVTFTDKQREQITAMVDAGDTMGAQKIILHELTKEFGGSAAAAGDAASPLQEISLRFHDLAEKAGPIVIDFLDKGIDLFDTLVGKVQDLPPGLQKIMGKAAVFAAGVGPILIVAGKLSRITGSVVTNLGGMAKKIGGLGGHFEGAGKKKDAFSKNLNTNLVPALETTTGKTGGLIAKLGTLAATWIGPVAVGAAVTALVMKNQGDAVDNVRSTAEGANIAVQSWATNILAGNNTIDEAKVALDNLAAAQQRYPAITGGMVLSGEQLMAQLETLLAEADANTKGFDYLAGSVSGADHQIKETTKSLKGMPEKTKIYVQTFGLAEAEALSGSALGFLNALDNKHVDIDVAMRLYRTDAGLSGFAGGGRTTARRVVVGEEGPEIADLPIGTNITPADRSRRILAMDGHAGADAAAPPRKVVNVVNVYVQGSVRADHDLALTVRRELIEIERRNAFRSGLGLH